MNVLLETSPLRNAHAVRGVGVYTRYLSKELEKLENDNQHFFTSEDIGLENIIAQTTKQGIDIIHYPYFDLFQQTLPFSFIQKLFGKAQQKIVITIHDVIPLLYPDYYRVGIRGNVNLFLQKQALESVSAIITDSQTSKHDIEKYLGVNPNKITSIPLAGNPEIKSVPPQTIQSTKKRLHLPEKYILYVGDINYNKNIPELISAMQYVQSDITLVCVGVNFKPQPIPEWDRIATNLKNVSNRVMFATSIPKGDNETLSAIYSGAELYVQPSLYEGFGLPLLEASQVGSLVVASNTPALKEIASEGVIFVEPTAQKLADGINRTLSLSTSEKRKKQEANLSFAQRFSWRKTAKETLRVYKSVL